MAKYVLSKSTTLQNRFLIVGDSKIISKPENQKYIRNSINIFKMPNTASTKVTAVYSTYEIKYFSKRLCKCYNRELANLIFFVFISITIITHI